MFTSVTKIFFHSRTPRVKYNTPLTEKSLIHIYIWKKNYFILNYTGGSQGCQNTQEIQTLS